MSLPIALVIPCNTIESKNESFTIKKLGFEAFGASSINIKTNENIFKKEFKIPMVFDKEFNTKFQELLAFIKPNIIICHHNVLFNRLKDITDKNIVLVKSVNSHNKAFHKILANAYDKKKFQPLGITQTIFYHFF